MSRNAYRFALSVILVIFAWPGGWPLESIARADLTITFGDLVPSGATTIAGPLYVGGYAIQTLTDSDLLLGSPFDVSSATTGGGTIQTAGNNPYYAGEVGLQWAQTDLLQITRVDGQPFTWTTIGLDEAVNPAPISITGYAMVYGITNNVQVSETQISLIPFSYGFEEYANQQPSVGSTAVWIPQGGLPFQISDITLTTDFATAPSPSAVPEPSSAKIVLFTAALCATAGMMRRKWPGDRVGRGGAGGAAQPQ